MDLEKVKRAFRRNRYECQVFQTKEEAADYLNQKIDGTTVGFGDSLTLQAMGMYEKLSTHNTVYDVHQINRERDGFERPASAANYFFISNISYSTKLVSICSPFEISD